MSSPFRIRGLAPTVKDSVSTHCGRCALPRDPAVLDHQPWRQAALIPGAERRNGRDDKKEQMRNKAVDLC